MQILQYYQSYSHTQLSVWQIMGEDSPVTAGFCRTECFDEWLYSAGGMPANILSQKGGYFYGEYMEAWACPV